MVGILQHCPVNAAKFQPFVLPDGTMWARVNKAVYGTGDASRLWYLLVRSTLLDNGFSVKFFILVVNTFSSLNTHESCFLPFLSSLLFVAIFTFSQSSARTGIIGNMGFPNNF